MQGWYLLAMVFIWQLLSHVPRLTTFSSITRQTSSDAPGCLLACWPHNLHCLQEKHAFLSLHPQLQRETPAARL